MAKQYKAFTITGEANKTVWDGGLKGTDAMPKKLLGLLLNVSGQAGNQILLDRERKRLMSLYDYHIDTDEVNAADTHPKSDTKLIFIDIEADVPAGVTVMVGIACGATAKNVFGSYVYELK